jgi:hypothetical protein
MDDSERVNNEGHESRAGRGLTIGGTVADNEIGPLALEVINDLFGRLCLRDIAFDLNYAW